MNTIINGEIELLGGGEGQGARNQPDFGRAPRDGGVWGEELGQDLEKPVAETTEDLVETGTRGKGIRNGGRPLRRHTL